MERKYAKRLKRSFKKSLLDSPVPKIKILPGGKRKFLPCPLVPTKYVPQKPVPKPRTQKSKRPVPMLRCSLFAKPVDKKIKKLIKEIAPYYRPEAIRKFNQELRDKKNILE